MSTIVDTTARVVSMMRRHTRPDPRESASEWAKSNLVLGANEGAGQGPLSWRGREWATEIVDCISSRTVEDVAVCAGTQLGKTVVLFAMYGWMVCRDPSGLLWVLPTHPFAAKFSRDRIMPMAERSPCIRDMIPRKGKARHDWASGRQSVNGALIHFVGSNSPTELAGRPMRRVFLDETEKFPEESRGGEAGAIYLALQRTGGQPMPFRIRVTSPAMSDGPGWSEFNKGDQRRFHVVCPHCGKFVVLAWSHKTRLVSSSNEAWVRWDEQCSRSDGTIDFDRVHRSSRFECPHCAGHIQDHHKTMCLRGGKWIPTTKSAPTFRSYHLPSLYSISPNKTLGSIVSEFLQSKGTLEGLRGWINGTLAEPWDTEQERAERTEIILSSPPVLSLDDKTNLYRIMTVDVQRNSPEFWVIVRDWRPGGHSTLVSAEVCEGIENLRQRQAYHGVIDSRVGIDVKDGVRREEILQWIAQTGKIIKPGKLGESPIHLGWVPMEGYEREKRWKGKNGRVQIHGYEICPTTASAATLRKIEFAGDMILDILALLRKGPGPAFGISWEVVSAGLPDHYWPHLDSKVRHESWDRRTGRRTEEWVLRKSKTVTPDHWLDAEVMQIAFALQIGILPWGTKTPQPQATT